MQFISFGKIPRLSKECIITEKIDGTNACVAIRPYQEGDEQKRVYIDLGYTLYCQSRTRIITPDDDNAGFARWAYEHGTELIMGLGEGHHYGEWWGAKIGRKYGLDHKRFSIFNVARWNDDEVRPACCHVVPVLYTGDFSTPAIEMVLENLKEYGSVAAPGFMNPEGVVIYHTAAKQYFKKTYESLSKWELELKKGNK